MRLREPFQGWKLSSGHPMFHIVYLLGSRIALIEIDPENIKTEQKSILFQMNLAHILVPIFNYMSYRLDSKEYFAISKFLDTISIFQYQATIFYA